LHIFIDHYDVISCTSNTQGNINNRKKNKKRRMKRD
jgi:hypothetical protein